MLAWSCQQYMVTSLVIPKTPDYDDMRSYQIDLLLTRIYESLLVGYGNELPPNQQ